MERNMGSLLPRETFNYRRPTASSSSSCLQRQGKYSESRHLGLNHRKTGTLSNNVVNTGKGFKVPFKGRHSNPARDVPIVTETEREGQRLDRYGNYVGKARKRVNVDVSWERNAKHEEDDEFSGSDEDLEQSEDDLESTQPLSDDEFYD